MSSNPEVSQEALEFVTFLIRNHREIDAKYFSDNVFCEQVIRRHNENKKWNELEELRKLADNNRNQNEYLTKFIKDSFEAISKSIVN